MKIRTFAVTLTAPRNAAFNFLANIENLPRWAGTFCERVYLQRGGWWALTAEGELMIDMDIHPAAGVIDVSTGIAGERMMLTSIRVVALSAQATLVNFALVETETSRDGGTEREPRYELFKRAGRQLVTQFGGGELHPAEPAPAFLAAGLN
ncbi:hypothetical protein [Oleiharenicola lentus]|uniref:hypothetical protein n=1 Tax=Oleiharenicola lentus TaxID=2508720 RepID=UPI003F668DC9